MWEYMKVDLRLSPKVGNRLLDSMDQLNEAGRKGWELVSVDDGLAYLKRSVASESPSKRTRAYVSK